MSRPTTGATGSASSGGPILAIDTATVTAIIALGEADGTLRDALAWQAGYRHGEELLARIDELLARASLPIAEIGCVVVGTGPGAFTGLRVGLATAKALAHALGRPIVGVSTGRALLAAAAAARPADRLALLLPAGPSDRVVVGHDGSAVLLPGGREPDLPAGTVLVAVDLDGRAPDTACALGAEARENLAAALVRLGAERLAAVGADDLAGLVPEYVTLPRGVRAAEGEVRWSRDPR
jgi:tRNA threonylcarbamoyladenosine biosynthesis protein TsaB